MDLLRLKSTIIAQSLTISVEQFVLMQSQMSFLLIRFIFLHCRSLFIFCLFFLYCPKLSALSFTFCLFHCSAESRIYCNLIVRNVSPYPNYYHINWLKNVFNSMKFDSSIAQAFEEINITHLY